MPREPGKSISRRFSLKPLGGGIFDSRNPLLLSNGQTPDCENIDFHSDSVRAHGGAIKFNNQPAPHAGILTRTSFAPLFIGANQSVPQRGYVHLGYDQATDIGGDFAFADGGNPSQPASLIFHNRRGRSFDVEVSFELPVDEKLYVERTGSGATPREDLGDTPAYDEGLEETTLIWQKGGDRLSPLSCALAIVNTGGQYQNVTGDDTHNDRVSNYALVFLWLDAPAYGKYGPGTMRYHVGAGGALVATTGRYSTLAYRAIVASVFIEPGRQYSVAVSLNLDSGSTTSTINPTATWNSDGTFEMVVRDQLGNVTRCNTPGTDLFVWKGPDDSIDYLTRYGVRFSGRDALYLGLGYRFAPWSGWGFVPYGLDSAAMEAGGFRMLDVSAQAKPAAYTISHTLSHTSPNTYVETNLQGMHGGVATNLPNPLDPFDSTALPWLALHNTVVVPNQGTADQSEALKKCWLVLWGGTGDGELNGVRLPINYYYESGASFRFECGLNTTKDWVTEDFFVISFRWHQRPLRISAFKVFDTATGGRDWTSARTQFSLGSYTLLDDSTEPDLTKLVASWPLDDAGGGVCREIVAGRDGHLVPYALGRSKDGGLFLSGEGEALVLDFAENPVLQRELGAMLRSGTAGFAIEIRCRIPQAYYARETDLTTELHAQFAPVLAEWAIKEDVAPASILRFGHRARFPIAVTAEPFYLPMGFNLEAAVDSDQSNTGLSALLNAWEPGPANNWSTNAEWVGQTIRLQFGIQSTGVADTYVAYIAATPKTALNPANGDPTDAEFAYFTASTTINRRDLARTVITIGGAWRPETGWGYMETRAAIIVEEARVFGVAAPGSLPATTGAIVTNRDGKLSGEKSLPARDLESTDLLHPLGQTKAGINATEASATIVPSDASSFFTADPEDTIEALKETFLIIGGDNLEIVEEGTLPRLLREFYYVSSVAANGQSAILSRNYNDRSGENLVASSFRLIGYSTFNDDITQKALAIGHGASFSTAAVPSDGVFSGDFFANLAPVDGNWQLHVFSTQVSTREIIPQWSRGVAIPRRNPVLGMQFHQGKLFAVTRGCLFECDDRWRDDGPTDTLKTSLALRAADPLNKRSVLAPLQSDGVRFTSANTAAVNDMTLAAYNFDAWVKLDAYGEHQTIIWIGNPATNPALNAGSGFNTHRINCIMRLARGYPEFALGSTAAYTGTTRPEDGMFIARANVKLTLDRWTHVRWTLPGATAGAWVGTPLCFVNGRPAPVTLSSTQSGAAAGQWVQASTITSAADTGLRILLGVAHASRLAPEEDRVFANNVLEGLLLKPNRYHGYLHSLAGRVAAVVVHRLAVVSAFDPFNITYGTKLFEALAAPEGIGHKTIDTVAPQYGLIESHPAVSLFHEMGLHTKPASWARYGARLFVTNGGRPVYAQLES